MRGLATRGKGLGSERLGFSTVVMAVGLCASALGAEKNPVDHLIAIGWVQAAGEIRIYPRKADLGKLYDQSCISGVMTGRRMLPKKLNNHHVMVYGRLMERKDLDEMTSRGVTIGVENYCDSDKIAIITRIVDAPMSSR